MATLSGRRAVVTGGGRGIGRAIAHRLAAEGASVVVTARTVAEIEDVAASIREAGGSAAAVPCDISDDESVGELASAAAAASGGPVDTLVNNAGVYLSRRFEDHGLDDWRWMLDLNVVSLVRVTQAFLPTLLEQPRSRVINVSSIAGKKGSFGQAAYNASKHAQIGITRCLALETGHTGLRVNAVCPGFTPTELARSRRARCDAWQAGRGGARGGGPGVKHRPSRDAGRDRRRRLLPGRAAGGRCQRPIPRCRWGDPHHVSQEQRLSEPMDVRLPEASSDCFTIRLLSHPGQSVASLVTGWVSSDRCRP